MTFNSIEFVLFLALVLGLHWTVPVRWRNRVILVASYVFYGWVDVRLVSLLALSTVVDFTAARRIADTGSPDSKRRWLLVSLTCNLGVLALFKYAGFFLDSVTSAISQLGLQANPPLLQIVLPVGISFYTFQTIAYTVDVYRGRLAPSRSLIDFATYVAYFPQLVAGPIERAGRLLPQITRQDRDLPRGPVLQRALSLIALGLVKKIVLADGVAAVVNSAFDAPDQQSWITLMAALVGFAVQIYGDFSGYSNIARGVSLLFGIELMTNFREPYLSRDITEFWRRWHISLSSWLRDYLYVPLGGNRHGNVTQLRNLMITMLLGGLWHGASWTFVVWGGIHGLLLAVHRLVRRPTLGVDRPLGLGDTPRIVATFGLVTLAWAFFRADSVGQAVSVLGGILTLRSGLTSPADLVLVAVLVTLMVGLDLAQRRQLRLGDRPLVSRPVPAGLVAAGIMLLLVVFSGGTPQPFIYFRF